MGKIKSSNQLSAIRDRITETITNINSLMDVQQGHVIKDIVIDAPGQEFYYAYVLLDYVNTIKSLNGVEDLIDNESAKEDIRVALDLDTMEEVEDLISVDLDDLASVHGVTRRAATYAHYLQRFYRTDNNSGNTITIPVGTTVKLADGTVVAAVESSVPQVPILDSETGLYYVEETVVATTAGTAGNVALNTLTIIAPQISQSTSTSNVTLLKEGANEETDSELIARIREVRKGRNLQTLAGLNNIALGTAEESSLEFYDSLVVDPTNSLMTRAYAGAVDIYVIGKNIQTFETRVEHEGDGTEYTLPYQPVESIISVEGSVSGPLVSVSYIDDSSAVYGSTRAYSSVAVFGGVAGETLTITYRVDQAIVNAQRLIDSDEEFTVPAADILFRQGIQVSINVECEVFYYGERAQAEVEADIRADLAAFFDGGTTSNDERLASKNLGEDIDRSDVINIIGDVDDVDRVTITGDSSISFYKDGVLTESDPISIADNEYARLGTVTFL